MHTSAKDDQIRSKKWKKNDFSLCLGFPLGINVHKDEYTNWGHFKKHSAKSLTMAK